MRFQTECQTAFGDILRSAKLHSVQNGRNPAPLLAIRSSGGQIQFGPSWERVFERFFSANFVMFQTIRHG